MMPIKEILPIQRSNQFRKAWLRPKIVEKTELVLYILAPRETTLSSAIYAVYHGRYIDCCCGIAIRCSAKRMLQRFLRAAIELVDMNANYFFIDGSALAAQNQTAPARKACLCQAEALSAAVRSVPYARAA